MFKRKRFGSAFHQEMLAKISLSLPEGLQDKIPCCLNNAVKPAYPSGSLEFIVIEPSKERV